MNVEENLPSFDFLVYSIFVARVQVVGCMDSFKSEVEQKLEKGYFYDIPR